MQSAAIVVIGKVMILTETLSACDEVVAQLPGGAATRTSFVVFDGATDRQLHEALSQIRKMSGALAWWLGDVGLVLQERKRTQLAKEAIELRTRAAEVPDDESRVKADLLEKAQRLEECGVIEYTAEFCKAHDLDEGYFRQCVMISRFYDPSVRTNGLKYEHHVVAMRAAGGARGEVKKAQQWLQTAEKAHWKAAELRREVNTAAAGQKPAEAPQEANAFDELDAADQWALAHGRNVIHPDAAVLMLTRWEALFTFVDRIRHLVDSRK